MKQVRFKVAFLCCVENAELDFVGIWHLLSSASGLEWQHSRSLLHVLRKP